MLLFSTLVRTTQSQQFVLTAYDFFFSDAAFHHFYVRFQLKEWKRYTFQCLQIRKNTLYELNLHPQYDVDRLCVDPGIMGDVVFRMRLILIGWSGPRDSSPVTRGLKSFLWRRIDSSSVTISTGRSEQDEVLLSKQMLVNVYVGQILQFKVGV